MSCVDTSVAVVNITGFPSIFKHSSTIKHNPSYIKVDHFLCTVYLAGSAHLKYSKYSLPVSHLLYLIYSPS